MSLSGSNAIEEVSHGDFQSHEEHDKRQNDGKVIRYSTSARIPSLVWFRNCSRYFNITFFSQQRRTFSARFLRNAHVFSDTRMSNMQHQSNEHKRVKETHFGEETLVTHK